MNMRETLSEVFPCRAIRLGGPSANPTWNVPQALHSLCGEIEAARLLLQFDDLLQEQRLAVGKEDGVELGLTTICVVVTSMIAERAVKTLIAQDRPDKPPWSGVVGAKGHSLAWLFNHKLHPEVQREVERQLETLPPFWRDYSETSSAAEILAIADTNFVDWRYVMEDGAGGGIPKPLLKVGVALTLVGVSHLIRWQESRGL